ncbi:MAG TPA: hypothetical protein VHV08_04445 [Pirellulales bacterium]|nr:hypothetical protein [Pirellulales bacterium]
MNDSLVDRVGSVDEFFLDHGYLLEPPFGNPLTSAPAPILLG